MSDLFLVGDYFMKFIQTCKHRKSLTCSCRLMAACKLDIKMVS